MQKGFTVVYILIGLFVLVVVAGSAFWLGTKKNSLSVPLSNQIQTTPVMQSTSIPVTTFAPGTIPQANALYYDTFEGVEALFVTNSKLSEYLENRITIKTNPYFGQLEKVDGTGISSSFDYKNLKNPRKILTLSYNVFELISFKLSNDRKSVYVSLILETKPQNIYSGNLTNHIYKVNLETLANKDLWSYDMITNEYKYNGARGATHVEQISSDNNYLVLSIFGCHFCEGSEPGRLVLNIQTKNEKYFELSGNVQLDLNTGTFTYQKLFPFTEPCNEVVLNCNIGQTTTTVYKPSGQDYTEKLP